MMRRWMICVLVAALTCTVIGWIIYIPSAALQTLKPVPAHAQIVYCSAQPSRAVLERFSRFRNWKDADRFFKMLIKNPVAVATVPLGGLDRRDTWVAVSAMGSRGFLLRWQLMLFPSEGIKSLRSYGSWPVWQYSDPSFPLWMRVRFTITEGLLICSISDDSHDIYYLLDTLDGRRPSAERKER